MIYTELTNKAMRIAYNAHHGQYDVNGVPYIFHPYHVAEHMTDEITTCVALLHDVIEDTSVTIEELEQVFPTEVTEAVRLLTHDDVTEYPDYTELTNKAMRIAYNAHHGQYDVNGVPYIFHPYHVAEQMTDEITTCVALLHDVVEDTPVTIEELEQVFPTEVTEAVRLLTHDDATAYPDYIERIKTNPVARVVKLADIAHNSDTSRITDLNAVPAERLVRWKRKYSEAKRILEKYQD